jgi:hypothetical protein
MGWDEKLSFSLYLGGNAGSSLGSSGSYGGRLMVWIYYVGPERDRWRKGCDGVMVKLIWGPVGLSMRT